MASAQAALHVAQREAEEVRAAADAALARVQAAGEARVAEVERDAQKRLAEFETKMAQASEDGCFWIDLCFALEVCLHH